MVRGVDGEFRTDPWFTGIRVPLQGVDNGAFVPGVPIRGDTRLRTVEAFGLKGGADCLENQDLRPE